MPEQLTDYINTHPLLPSTPLLPPLPCSLPLFPHPPAACSTPLNDAWWGSKYTTGVAPANYAACCNQCKNSPNCIKFAFAQVRGLVFDRTAACCALYISG